MALNLSATVAAYLKTNPETKFTARQIAEWILQTYPAECQQKKEASASLRTDANLVQQLVAEIGSQRPLLQKKNPGIKTTEERPRKYYFTSKTDAAEVEQAEAPSVALPVDRPAPMSKLAENQLYPRLSEYLWSEFQVFCKRIDEKRSTNRLGPNANKWLYPDMVGMEDLSAGWHGEIKDCVREYSDKKTKLWSFEVKLLLNRSNAREAFFQAVSNSSWANFGYLVAAEIEGDDTLREARMLSALHGIGLIRLDPSNPAESEILIPAMERAHIDWNTANRLATENRDFLDFIKAVRKTYQTGEPQKSDWDLPKQDD